MFSVKIRFQYQVGDPSFLYIGLFTVKNREGVIECFQYHELHESDIKKRRVAHLKLTSIISFAYSNEASLQYIICNNFDMVVRVNFGQFN